MKKYNFLYKTTNIVNGKIYIGVHTTNKLNDGYLGSGTNFKKAVKEFGRMNFKREILEFFETAKEAFNREKELVTGTFVLQENVYNLAPGGQECNGMSEDGKLRISEARKGSVVAKKNGKTILVNKEEFDSDNELVGVTQGFVTVTDGKTYFQVSVDDDRYLNGYLVAPSKNLVVAVDTNTGNRVVVSKEEFDVSPNLKGHTFGSKQTEKSNSKRSETLKGKAKPASYTERVVCPYCDKTGIRSNMKRWHFDNCKYSPNFDKCKFEEKTKKLFNNHTKSRYSLD